MSRAERRRRTARIRKRREIYWGDHGEGKRPQDGRLLGKKLSAPKPQSNCMCCMNQRILDGPTRQERAAELTEREGEQEQADEMFTCPNCGNATLAADRCPLTGECVYC